jgi:hypothetical protein
VPVLVLLLIPADNAAYQLQRRNKDVYENKRGKKEERREELLKGGKMGENESRSKKILSKIKRLGIGIG